MSAGLREIAALACIAAGGFGVRVAEVGDDIIPPPRPLLTKSGPKQHTNAREIARRQRQKDRAAAKLAKQTA